jgi:hypothetical protein
LYKKREIIGAERSEAQIYFGNLLKRLHSCLKIKTTCVVASVTRLL